MNQPAPVVQIVEVIGPAEQGKSIPFLCGGSDGHRYYVKAQQTNRSNLWREWICGHLAKALGLPLPPFALVQLDPALVKELPKDQQAIGSLPAFGSREQPHTAWLELGFSQRVPAELQRDVLVFDWWVRNTDRLRGNTNLLWDTEHEGLVVIDHNWPWTLISTPPNSRTSMCLPASAGARPGDAGAIPSAPQPRSTRGPPSHGARPSGVAVGKFRVRHSHPF